jgi:hypothetical protein
MLLQAGCRHSDSRAHRPQRGDWHLRHKRDSHTSVQHACSHLHEDLRLDHVIAVHNHDDVLLRNICGATDVWIQFCQDCVVQVCRLAVHLATLDTISAILHIPMPYMQCRVVWVRWMGIKSFQGDWHLPARHSADPCLAMFAPPLYISGSTLTLLCTSLKIF